MKLVCLGTMSDDKLAIVESYLTKNNVDAKIARFKSESYIDDQPLSRGETELGAMNRTYQAYNSGKYEIGMGMEGGLIVVSPTEKYLICIVAV